MKKEYWNCIIGPTTRDKLPMGADSPMRRAVKLAYEKMLDTGDYECSSGWGMSQARYDVVTSINCMVESDVIEVKLFIKELRKRRDKDEKI